MTKCDSIPAERENRYWFGILITGVGLFITLLVQTVTIAWWASSVTTTLEQVVQDLKRGDSRIDAMDNRLRQCEMKIGR